MRNWKNGHSWVYLRPLLLCIYPKQSDSLSTWVDDVPELQVGLVEVRHTGVLIHHHTHQVIREPLTALQVSHPQLLSVQHRHINKMSDPDQEPPPTIRQLMSSERLPLLQQDNKRPMGHIAHLRKQFKSLNNMIIS